MKNTNTQGIRRLGSMESNVFLNICNNYQLHTKIYAIYLTYNACMRVCIHVCVCVSVRVRVGGLLLRVSVRLGLIKLRDSQQLLYGC